MRYYAGDLRRKIAEAMIWAIGKIVYPWKDNDFSRHLHDVADEYDTRPTGQWSIKR